MISTKTISLSLLLVGFWLYGHTQTKDSISIISYLNAIEGLSLSQDSLIKTYKNTYTDSKKIKFKKGVLRSLTQLGMLHVQENQPEIALQYFVEATNITEKSNDFNKYNEIQFYIADIYLKEGLPERAVQILKNRKGIKTQQSNLVLFQRLAVAYEQVPKWDSSFYYYSKLTSFHEKKNNKKELIKNLGRIAEIHKLKKSFVQENTIRQKILSFVKENESNQELAIATNNVGYSYHNLKDYPKAINYFEKTLSMNPDQNWINLPKLYINLGVAYYNLREDRKAAKYLKKALAFSSSDEEQQIKAYTEFLLSNLYLRKKDYFSALSSIESAIETAKADKDVDLLAQSYKTASSIHEKLFNFDKTLTFYQQYLNLRDSLQLKKRLKQQNILQQKFNFEKAEKETKLLLANQDFQELTIRQLETEKNRLELTSANLELGAIKKEQELNILKKEQLVQTAFIKNKALEAERIKQDLLLAAKQIETSEKDKEIAELQFLESNQKLEIAKREAAEKEKSLQIEGLKQEKEIQELQIGQQEQFKRFAYLLGLGLLTVLGLILTGFVFARKTNKVLASKNQKIEKQNELIEKERDKSDQLLLNVLPSETANELKTKGFATPKSYKQVSVMFTDFTNFTSISSGFSPEKIIEELNICFKEFDRIIELHNLEKIKTIGDSYMVAGGIPIANTTNARDTVNAAIEMQKFIENKYQEQNSIGKPYWRMRVGIHTGPVVAGVIGDKKFAYDIWGDTVNTASRMESSSQPAKVNISENTYLLVKDDFSFKQRGTIEAKGKGGMKMYFVHR